MDPSVSGNSSLSPAFEWRTVELSHKSKEVPSSRWGHSMILAQDYLFVFGGYAASQYMNDIWRFNLKEGIWEKLDPVGDAPDKRSNHTAVYDSRLDRILVFGGGSLLKKRFNDTYAYNIKTNGFSKIYTRGLLPAARTYHTSVLLEDYMIVYGGEGTTDLDDLHLLNLKTSYWSEPKIKGKKPVKRRFHTATACEDKMFIFGGCNGNYNCLDDFYMIDFGNFLKFQDMDSLEWVEIRSEGSIPSPRWGHSCVPYRDSLYIFGGRSSCDFNDVHRFIIREKRWEKIEAGGRAPSERRRQTVELCGSHMIIFGGFNTNYFNCMHSLNLQYNSHIQPSDKKEKYRAKLWMSRKFSDVTFLVENRKIFAHKIFLYLIDPAFQQLFNISQENVIELTNIRYKYFDGIIRYCYSKTLDPNSNLGYILNMKFAARRLGLFNIETLIQDALERRCKLNRVTRNQNSSSQLNTRTHSAEEITDQDSNRFQERESLLQPLFDRFHSLSCRYHDVKVRTNGFIYNCHKIMLACAGPFFKNLLVKNFQESSSEIINISNITSRMFNIILFYIYFEDDFLESPAKSLQEQEWIALIKASHYLSLWKLISFCESRLAELLKPENIFYFLELSITYHLEILEKGCLEYTLNNYYSSELRIEFIKYIHCHESSDMFSLKLLKAFCEERRFEIYQKGITLKNNQRDYHGLDDILFENKMVKGIDLEAQTGAEYYESDEILLNTSNYSHVKNSLIID